jgi:hypothetical protein
MTGKNLKAREGINPVKVTLTSLGFPQATRSVTMYKPIDALILRRYSAPGSFGLDLWALPDDRKINPWDANEPDPTDKGTMGTIPGPVIECNVGDKVVVHFRNMDLRKGSNGKLLPIESRTHSLHPHGFAFASIHDGAYPLSPPDPAQAAGAESAAWSQIGVGNFKQGDRVPPNATFDYTWIAGAPSPADPTQIVPWPTTAGVWLYHDHSICDMDNVNLGAIGIIVIHNPNDPQEVDIRLNDSATALDPALLPGGSATGPVFAPIKPKGDG